MPYTMGRWLGALDLHPGCVHCVVKYSINGLHEAMKPPYIYEDDYMAMLRSKCMHSYIHTFSIYNIHSYIRMQQASSSPRGGIAATKQQTQEASAAKQG